MDEAGAVEQHVDRADLGEAGFHRVRVEHVKPARDDAFRAFQFGERLVVDVGGVDGGTGGREGQRAGAPYALRRRGDDDALACQILRHEVSSNCGQTVLPGTASGNVPVRRIRCTCRGQMFFLDKEPELVRQDAAGRVQTRHSIRANSRSRGL